MEERPLQARSETQSVIINEQKSGEATKLFSSSALNIVSFEIGERCWQRGEKGPSEIPLSQTTARCLMSLWQPWPISAQQQEWSKILEQMLLLFRCFPAVLGFLSLDFLREEMLAHPEQPLPNYPECVGAPHAGGVMPQGENNSTASPLKLMYSSEATMERGCITSKGKK